MRQFEQHPTQFREREKKSVSLAPGTNSSEPSDASAGGAPEPEHGEGLPICAHMTCLAMGAWALGLMGNALTPSWVRRRPLRCKALALGVAGTICGAAWYMARQIWNPLQRISNAAEKAAQGRRFERIEQGRCPRELSLVSNQFNRMMERVERAESALQSVNGELEKRVAERTAALAATNKELEAFSYSVSHDLRAPVRLINSFSELLEKESEAQLSPRGHEYVDCIRHEAQHMNEMIEALLRFAHLARAPLEKERVDLSALATEISHALQESAPERQVDFLIQPGLTATGDARLLRLVLQNLLGNAWKFSRNNPSARVEFGFRSNNGEPSRMFFVRDNGAGFDMAGAGRLFTPFQRLHTSSEFEGVGVGLATVKRIIQRHGGSITAESTPGRGATFYFSLP